eukprot:2097483-Rhodomonas_salina.1
MRRSESRMPCRGENPGFSASRVAGGVASARRTATNCRSKGSTDACGRGVEGGDVDWPALRRLSWCGRAEGLGVPGYGGAQACGAGSWCSASGGEG